MAGLSMIAAGGAQGPSGGWLAAHEYFPGEVIHSTASRATETWARIEPSMNGAAIARAEPRLYHSAPSTMLDVLRSARAPVVMLVGHNPGCALFVAGMCRMPSRHPAFNKYPTCATCILDFEANDWRDVAAGTGDIVDFIVPRQLLG